MIRLLGLRGVLIVPCGMETLLRDLFTIAKDGINCTLRNGNKNTGSACCAPHGVLIVPCGMETGFVTLNNISLCCINCTLRNGNI